MPFRRWEMRDRRGTLAEVLPGIQPAKPPKNSRVVFEEGDIVELVGGEKTTVTRSENYMAKSSLAPHGSGGRAQIRIWVKDPRDRSGKKEMPVNGASLKLIERVKKPEQK